MTWHAGGTDDQADLYTNRPFNKVAKTIWKVHHHLEPVFAAAPGAFPKPRGTESPNNSRGKIRRIEQLHGNVKNNCINSKCSIRPWMTDAQDIRRRFRLLNPALNERTRRLGAASEAKLLGRGGVSTVTRVIGIARRALAAGLLELSDRRALSSQRVRRSGGGRQRLTHLDPQLRERLDRLVEPTTRGDPMSPLRWTSNRVRHLAGPLTRQGHPVSYRTVAALLQDMGYRLQSPRQNPAGADPPDRDR